MRFQCVYYPLTIYVLLLFSVEADTQFSRQDAALDVLNAFVDFEYGFIPLQLVPTYRVRCLSKRYKKQQLLTVWKGDDHTLQFFNFWSSDIVRKQSKWSLHCPESLPAMGMSCWNENCQKPRLLCGAPDPGFRIVPVDSAVAWTSSADLNGSVICPGVYYAQGVECMKWFCYPAGLYCVQLHFQNLPQRKFSLRPAGNRIMVSTVFTSARRGFSKLMSGPVFAMSCERPNCDEVQMFSVIRGARDILGPVEFWTGYVGEEALTAVCPPGMIVRQMRCKGRFGSLIALGCASVSESNNVQLDYCDHRASNVFGRFDLPRGRSQNGYYVYPFSSTRRSCEQIGLGCVSATYIE